MEIAGWAVYTQDLIISLGRTEPEAWDEALEAYGLREGADECAEWLTEEVTQRLWDHVMAHGGQAVQYEDAGGYLDLIAER